MGILSMKQHFTEKTVLNKSPLEQAIEEIIQKWRNLIIMPTKKSKPENQEPRTNRFVGDGAEYISFVPRKDTQEPKDKGNASSTD